MCRLDQGEERRVALDGGMDVRAPPQVDPGAPVGRSGVEQLAGARRRRIRLKTIDGKAAQRAGSKRVAVSGPDVAPPGVGVGRGHTERDQGRREPAGGLGRGERVRHGAHGLAERIVVPDLVIGDDHEHRLVRGSLHGHGRQRDRGGSVAMDRLGEHEGIRKEASDHLPMPSVGHDDHVERVDQRREPLDRPFQAGPPILGLLEGHGELTAGRRALSGPAIRKDHQVHPLNHAPCRTGRRIPRRNRSGDSIVQHPTSTTPIATSNHRLVSKSPVTSRTAPRMNGPSDDRM